MTTSGNNFPAGGTIPGEGTYPDEGTFPTDGTSTLSPSPEFDTDLSSGTSSSTGQSTKDVAKNQAADVAGTAADAGKHVASVAGDQAQQVAQEVSGQAKDLFHQARGEFTDQAATQQQRAAKSLRALGDEFESMASGSDHQGPAADLTRQAAERVQTVASWLEEREPGQLLDEVSSFARRKPGLFLAIAAGAGIAAGRLGRGAAAGSSTTGSSSTSTSATSHQSGPVLSATPPGHTPSAAPTSIDSNALGYAAPPTTDTLP